MNKGIMYRGYEIKEKQDFGTGFFIDGFSVRCGYIAVKNGCLALPGGTWGQTVAQVKEMVDILEAVGEEKFWATYQKIVDAKREAVNAVLRETRKVCNDERIETLCKQYEVVP